jgi:hypothetical protein
MVFSMNILGIITDIALVGHNYGLSSCIFI